MTWQQQVPSEPGFYWWRHEGLAYCAHADTIVVYLFRRNSDSPVEWMHTADSRVEREDDIDRFEVEMYRAEQYQNERLVGSWFGPLQPPDTEEITR